MPTRPQKEGEREGERKKVGYHSGSWLLEIAGSVALATCLTPFSSPAQVVYLDPNFRALTHWGKVGRDCLPELIRCVCVRLGESKLQHCALQHCALPCES